MQKRELGLKERIAAELARPLADEEVLGLIRGHTKFGPAKKRAIRRGRSFMRAERKELMSAGTKQPRIDKALLAELTKAGDAREMFRVIVAHIRRDHSKKSLLVAEAMLNELPSFHGGSELLRSESIRELFDEFQKKGD